EFLNRIDDTIIFHTLTEDNIKEIVALMAKEIAVRIKENMDITVEFNEEAIAYIAKEGFDPAYGARPLRRALQSKVEDKFAESFLENNFKNGDTVIVGMADNEITVTLKSNLLTK
ncbi:MAG: ATP-dependent Clp protease ATP-binding subunit ClpC, partial [Anaerotignaceae bacterium]